MAPTLPPSLTAECKEMLEYQSGELTEILETHGVNMQNANRCRQRHRALVEALEQFEKSHESEQ